jgi:hypothetical protein
MLEACTSNEPPESKQAADAVAATLRPINLSRSMFSVVFPDGTPSQFVRFMFPDMGSAEWPPADAWADETMGQQMAAIGQPLLPAGVAITARTVDPDQAMQLVIGFDDEKGTVSALDDLDPTSEPMLVREWKLPKVQAAASLLAGKGNQQAPSPCMIPMFT